MEVPSKDKIEKLKQKLKFIKDYPKPGINFCDIMPLLACPESLHLLVDIFAEVIKHLDFDVVIGL